MTTRHDTRLIPAICTALLGGVIFALGLNMPQPRGLSSAPGLFPMIIGGVLVILAGLLLLERRRLLKASLTAQPLESNQPVSSTDVQAIKAEAEARDLASPDEPWRPMLMIAVGLAAYLVSLTWAPYEVATAVFLLLGMLAFGERKPSRMVLGAVGFVLVIPLVFILVLEALLPGSSSLVEMIFY